MSCSFSHLYMVEINSSNVEIFIIFLFFQTLFPSTAFTMSSLFFNQFETAFLAQPYFFPVAIEL